MSIIRIASIEDAEIITKINANEFGYSYPLDKTKKNIEYLLTKSTDRIFVVCEDEKVVGYIHACNYEGTYFDAQKNIMAIAIDNSCQGKGYGKALLNAVENWAKENNCEGVRLASGMNRKKAHKFYSHCGYRLRKKQKNFIKLF